MKRILHALSAAVLCFTLVPDTSAQITVTASSDVSTVQQGGQVTFTYQVCNNGDESRTGVTFYRVLAIPSGVPVTDYVELVSGTLGAMTCSPDLSFTVNVPGSTPPDLYNVRISAGPGIASPAASALVTIEVTEATRLADSADEWTLVGAAEWHIPAAVAAAPSELSAYPNPFAERTTLAFTLAEATEVRLAVYDVLGREVAVLADGSREAGVLEADFEAAHLPSGVYVVRLMAGRAVETTQVTLLR